MTGLVATLCWALFTVPTTTENHDRLRETALELREARTHPLSVQDRKILVALYREALDQARRSGDEALAIEFALGLLHAELELEDRDRSAEEILEFTTRLNVIEPRLAFADEDARQTFAELREALSRSNPDRSLRPYIPSADELRILGAMPPEGTPGPHEVAKAVSPSQNGDRGVLVDVSSSARKARLTWVSLVSAGSVATVFGTASIIYGALGKRIATWRIGDDWSPEREAWLSHEVPRSQAIWMGVGAGVVVMGTGALVAGLVLRSRPRENRAWHIDVGPTGWHVALRGRFSL